MSYKFIKTILIICLLVYSNVESAIAHAEDNLGYAKDSSIFSKSPNENQNSDNDSIPDLLVFASFSIPEHSLKQLSEQVKKAKGVLVGGVLELNLRKLAVKATPEQLVDHIDVDVSALELGKAIKVQKLETPFHVLTPGSIPLARIIIPRAMRSAKAKEAAAPAKKKK